MTFDQHASSLAHQLGQQYQSRGWQLALAESCTGGMIAQTVTSLAGSSAWFERGFVTYSNAAKTELLSVPAEMIAEKGAVSVEVAQAMATGALAHSHADWSASVTGIAGPGGGSVLKPVGMVCFAFARRFTTGEIVCVSRFQQQFVGDRQAVREQSTLLVLTQLIHLDAQANEHNPV